MKYPTYYLYFLGIHTLLKVRVHTGKIQVTEWDISWFTTKNRTRAAANCCHGKRRKRRHFVLFVMNISGAEFEEKNEAFRS